MSTCPAALGWCADPPRPPADASHSCDVRRHRTAHDLYSAKVCYRYHPHYGVAVQLVRYLRRGSAAVVIVRLPNDSQLALPEWMLKPEACEELKIQARPQIAMSALVDLSKLIKAQLSAVANHSPSCAESATGGRDAQPGESGCTARQAPLRRQRALGDAARSGAGALSKSLERTIDECSEEG